jgi:hypothetical protein
MHARKRQKLEISTPVKRIRTSSPTRTPRTPARDLSELFTPSPKRNSPASPAGVAKRMLSRARTEPSLQSGDSPGPSGLQSRCHSLNLPTLHPPPSPPLPSLQSVHTTRTYAGKSRSFLIHLPANVLHSQEGVESESYTSLRTKYNIDISSDDPSYPRSPPPSHSKGKHNQIDLDPNMHNPLSSITDLRSKGESRRFLDEVGYLFEGMDTQCGITLRRARYVC